MRITCLFFICGIFLSSICVAQNTQTEETFEMLRIAKDKKANYVQEMSQLYGLHRQRYDRKRTINSLERLVQMLSPAHDTDAIVRVCEFLSDEYRAEIAQDRSSIQYASAFLLSVADLLKNTCQAGEIYSVLGILYTHENIKDYHTAKEYFEKNIQMGKLAACKNNQRNTVYPYIIISKHLYEKTGDYAKAHTNYLRAVHLADSLQLSLEQRAYYEDRLARLYYKTENYNEAYRAWERMLAHLQRANIKNIDLIQAFNNLGLVKRKKNELSLAEEWFEKALREAKDQKDAIWEGIISGNLGYTAFLRKDYAKAIELLEKDIKICLKHKEYNNVVSSLIHLGGAHQAQKEYAKALKSYEEAVRYLKEELTWIVRYEPQADLRLYRDVYKGLSDVWEAFDDYKQAHQYSKLHKRYSDTLLFLQSKENLALQQAKQEFNTKNKEKEASLRQQQIFIIFLIILVILIAGISLLTFRNYRLIANKKKLEAENLALAHEAEMERNQRLQEAMVIKEQQMAISALQMQQKNEMLLELKKEIVVSDNSSKKLEKMVDYSIDLDHDWDEFRQHFEQIHPLFFHKIQQMSDKITPNDLKHCAYMRINLDSKQIAHLMRITPESVKMSRNRLRKKLNLPAETDLYKFLASL
jgi:tetratricopeptide (TPR) repeat protein